MLLGLAPCPRMGARPWDACETVCWELWQAAGTWGWAGSEWLGPFPCCKPLQAGRHCQGQGVQPGQRGRKPSQLSALTASMETPPVGLFSVGCFVSALSLQHLGQQLPNPVGELALLGGHVYKVGRGEQFTCPAQPTLFLGHEEQRCPVSRAGPADAVCKLAGR